MHHLSPEALAADLAVRDLTDPAHGPHAIQQMVDAVLAAACAHWPAAELLVHRGERIVAVADNYDRLGYHPAAAARDSRYSRYVDDHRMLRSQTSALIPGALRRLTDGDALIACPGMVHRRDAIDRLHTGTPHQLDLWRVGPGDLHDLVELAVGAALPGVTWRTRPATHPYTTDGREIEARTPTGWVEIGECGVAAAHVLPGRPGLALGLGLDRLVMLRKGVDDIRLLRSTDPRVADQMSDLSPYRPVSTQPAARRDVSVALPAGVTGEDVGDRVRTLLGSYAGLVEEVTIRSVTPPELLPATSRERLGIRPGEVNVLVGVVLRDLHTALPKEVANALRDRIYAGLMDGRAT